jgi:hypothetical protein
MVRFSRSRKDYLAKVCEKLAECASVALCVVGLASLFSGITLKGMLMTVSPTSKVAIIESNSRQDNKYYLYATYIITGEKD